MGVGLPFDRGRSLKPQVAERGLGISIEDHTEHERIGFAVLDRGTASP